MPPSVVIKELSLSAFRPELYNYVYKHEEREEREEGEGRRRRGGEDYLPICHETCVAQKRGVGKRLRGFGSIDRHKTPSWNFLPRPNNQMINTIRGVRRRRGE